MMLPFETRRLSFILVILMATGLLFTPTSVEAQSSGLDVLMTGVHIDVVLQENGTSRIQFDANVTNLGSEGLASFDVRIELRSIAILRTTVNDLTVPTNLVEEDRYTRITVTPSSQIDPGESHHLIITLESTSLQEKIEICEDRGICIENMIYYVRPLNEFQDFRFTVTLPQHAVLDSENTPLYPTPTSNYTDGASMIFMWEVNQILPGQERVYIIKYGLPQASLVTSDSGANDLLLFLAALLIGAVAVIVIERVPDIIRTVKTPTIIAERGVTDHENEVIMFLSKKGGSSPQRDIYRELDMSQSLASMILTGLEQRGIIKRFREGRENIVHLVED